MKNIDFENYLCSRNDEVDNAVYDMLCTLASVSGEDTKPEWDMEIIGNLADYAETMLNRKSVETCRPFSKGEEETPCYLSSDCRNPNCPFRNKT